MNPLVELGKLGQSVWYDNIRRAMLDNGELAAKIKDDGLRGMTSNPTIFEKAIAGSTDYDTAMRGLIGAGKSVVEIYESLAIEDIQRACDLFRTVYDSSAKLAQRDGYVSFEVSPLLAHDTDGTIAEAKRLWAAVACIERTSATTRSPLFSGRRTRATRPGARGGRAARRRRRIRATR